MTLVHLVVTSEHNMYCVNLQLDTSFFSKDGVEPLYVILEFNASTSYCIRTDCTYTSHTRGDSLIFLFGWMQDIARHCTAYNNCVRYKCYQRLATKMCSWFWIPLKLIPVFNQLQKRSRLNSSVIVFFCVCYAITPSFVAVVVLW